MTLPPASAIVFRSANAAPHERQKVKHFHLGKAKQVAGLILLFRRIHDRSDLIFSRKLVVGGSGSVSGQEGEYMSRDAWSHHVTTA